MKQRCAQSERPRYRAFSLVELLAVMAILAIVAAIATPRYAQASVRFRTKNAAHRITVDLEFARRAAVDASSPRTVTFIGTQLACNTPDRRRYASDNATYRHDLAEEPYGVTSLVADFGGDGDVIFDMYGRPDSGGTVVVAIGAETQTVVLDADTGEAEVQ